MNRDRIRTMLELQDQLNTRIHSTWVHAGYPWHRAIWTEAAEALEHHGWKWWKAHGEPDVAQIRLELVDIWHFGMSLVLVTQNGDIDKAADVLTDYFGQLDRDPDVLGKITNQETERLLEILAGSAALHEQFNGPTFNALMLRFELTWAELYRTYLAKNVLNLFRQDHGYKDGTYIKNWNGQEDNVVLASIMAAAPDAGPWELAATLKQVYKTVRA